MEQPPVVAVSASDSDRSEATYTIRMSDLCRELKMQHALSVAKEKTGALGGRIFRVLHTYQRLEEKQLSEIAIAPKKRVREVLYALLHAKFVSLQEIPRGADRNPSRSFYLWGVPTAKVLDM